jgi:prophage antirepressor-like protein
VVTIDGNPWFLGTEVCAVLGIENASNAYARLDSNEKTNIRRMEVGLGHGRDAVLINESSLYKLVMRSDKPEAKDFQNWVTKVVLPAIRKDGTSCLTA